MHDLGDIQLTDTEYRELRDVAKRYFRAERPGHTLQPTALVHEAYLRLAGRANGRGRDRSEFLALAAREMRRVLVDHARRRSAVKRGGELVRVPLDEEVLAGQTNVDFLDFADVLEEFGRLDPAAARVVELRVFGGLTVSEAAASLAVSPRTVEEDWRMARAWLLARLDRR